MPLIGITGDSSHQSYRGNYDNVPFNISFENLTDIYPKFVYASNPQKIEGINYKVQAKVKSGDAKLLIFYDEDDFTLETSEDGSSYYQYIGLTTTSEIIRPGANIILFIEAISEGNPINETLFNRIYSNNISIGKLNFPWTVTTSSIPSPTGLKFTNVINAPLNSQIISNDSTISGLLDDVSYTARITSDEGRLSVNSGSNVINSTVVDGDKIKLILPKTATTQLTTKQVIISISASNGAGLAQTTWSVTTERINPPIGLSFNNVTGANFGVEVISNTYTVSGLTSNTTYTAEIVGNNGFFRVNSGTNTKRATVNNNDIIRLVLPQTALTDLTTTSITFRIFQSLDVGDVDTTWNVTTKEKNKNITLTPSDFTDVTDANLDTFYNSNELTISGLDANTTLPVSTVNADYKVVRGTTTIKDYSSTTPVEVTNNDKISLRMKSSIQNFTEVSSSLTIGNTSSDWKITTKPPTPVFNPANFTDTNNAELNSLVESNQITLSQFQGSSTPSTISGPTTVGELQVERNGIIVKNYTDISVPFQQGDKIRLRIKTQNSYSYVHNIKFTIRDAETNWKVTTKSPPAPPNISPSDFTDLLDAELNTEYFSNSVTILTPTTASISVSSNVKYRITRNGIVIKDYDSNPVNVINGDILRLKLTTPNLYSTTVQTTVSLSSVGGETNISWNVRTRAQTVRSYTVRVSGTTNPSISASPTPPSPFSVIATKNDNGVSYAVTLGEIQSLSVSPQPTRQNIVRDTWYGQYTGYTAFTLNVSLLD